MPEFKWLNFVGDYVDGLRDSSISWVRKILIVVFAVAFWLFYFWYKGIDISRPKPQAGKGAVQGASPANPRDAASK